MNDIQLMDEIYNKIYNSTVYILDNSTYYKYDKLLFNISGEINDPQPKLENKNLTLMINLESDTKIETEIVCTINNKTRQNYILNCKANETFESYIQSSVSFIDNSDILLINFDTNIDSIIFVEETKNMGRIFRKNKRNNFGAGVIIGLIIALIVAIALVIFLTIYCRKENKKYQFDIDSSIAGLKKIKNK